jgi:hypothetical protein
MLGTNTTDHHAHCCGVMVVMGHLLRTAMLGKAPGLRTGRNSPSSSFWLSKTGKPLLLLLCFVSLASAPSFCVGAALHAAERSCLPAMCELQPWGGFLKLETLLCIDCQAIC